MKRKRRSNISKSALADYHRCPRRWYFAQRPDIPKMTDYPRLCGVEVHSFVARRLYRKTKEPRPFFYKTKTSAIKAWFHRWHEALKANMASLILPDEENAEKFGSIGALCISNYWNGNYSLPRPLEIEKRYETRYKGFLIVGIFDQIRTVTEEFIHKQRPELIRSGKLRKGYDPVVIYDLKTEFIRSGFRPEDSLEAKRRAQYFLHEGLEPTFYTYLYECRHGKKPVGFAWYNLQLGKFFFTYRTNNHYHQLFYEIDSFLESLQTNFFSARKGKQCCYCDYLEYCHEGRDFLIAEPQNIEDGAVSKLIALLNPVPPNTEKQLSLKLKVPRSKKSQSKKVIDQQTFFRPHDFPW